MSGTSKRPFSLLVQALHDVELRAATADGGVFTVSACRCLLAGRSDYFRVLLFGPMRCDDHVVDIGDVPSESALRGVVRFCVTGRPTRCDSLVEVVELHSLAQRLSLFMFADAILHCLGELDKAPAIAPPYSLANLKKEYSAAAVLRALTRAAELLDADCIHRITTTLVADSELRAMLFDDTYQSFAQAHPNAALQVTKTMSRCMSHNGL